MEDETSGTEWAEPEEGDYILSDRRGGGINVSEHGGKLLGMFAWETDGRTVEQHAFDFIAGRMARDQFWPNVWRLSDHGNWIGPIDWCNS